MNQNTTIIENFTGSNMYRICVDDVEFVAALGPCCGAEKGEE
jgi:hypothetical protein